MSAKMEIKLDGGKVLTFSLEVEDNRVWLMAKKDNGSTRTLLGVGPDGLELLSGIDSLGLPLDDYGNLALFESDVTK